jgi:hypothetical protein
MPSVHPQRRKWCFTINNPVESDDPGPVLGAIRSSIKYAVWQKERGDNEGTLHWQGFVEFKTRGRRLTGMKDLFPRAHLEAANGSALQNKEYCTKEEGRVEGPYEIGACPEGGAGRRSDLLSVKRRIEEGASDREIASEFFGQWCRYERAFKRYRMMVQVGRQWQTKVKVFWGEPGTGKTKLAQKLAMEEADALGSSVFVLNDAMRHGCGVWWDGYAGEEVVIIEEFEGWISRNQFKGLVNHSPLNVQVKGGAVSFRARSIYITSNKKPSEWWKIESQTQREAWPQIVRRLSPPIGRVLKATRNPQVPASDEQFNEGFCQIEDDPGAVELNDPVIPLNVFHVNGDVDV